MPRFLHDLNLIPDFVDASSYSLKQKKVISKVLYGLGWGSPTIAKWLNISRGTVLKANQQPTPDSLLLFEFVFKQEILKINYQVIYQVNKKIMDLVPVETDINKLVDAGEYFSQIRV